MNNLQAILTDERIYLTTENGIYYADVLEENGDEHGLCQAHSLYEFEQELEACGVIGA